MKSLPLNIGRIHFVGIGGIGMSGIAEVMHNLGYIVQGSDLFASNSVDRLKTMGIKVKIGHDEKNINDAEVIVVSSAISKDNPEIVAARANFIPIVQRAEMLAELMRLKWSIAVAGTHGKTTTTSIIAQVLDGVGLDPTVINGGIINAYGTNARLGDGEWMVVESDESDGSFVKLPATVAVVTNIDPEHMEFYGDFDSVRSAYRNFVESIPFYGFAALCIDHPEVQSLIGKIWDRRIITYGLSPQADICASSISSDAFGSVFDVSITDRHKKTVITLEKIRFPMLGTHNVLNSLAAIAIAREMGIDHNIIQKSLREFKGVKRRFTLTGNIDGIVIIDDYGHHPVEISAVLESAREAYKGKIVAVVQPHRFSRLKDLFEDFCVCFNNADIVVVSDVYAAGEAPIPGVNRDSLVEGLRARGHRNVMILKQPEDLAELINPFLNSGDIVVCLGAGTITHWANALPKALGKLRNTKDMITNKPSTGSVR
ncbi:MAG: UDP-N-acetylmuramate--L-alanine ligase [Rhodospirillaceae bacterium]|nr:UDP-N-acetylmuramate--L-alanine ligase [Rhodospirillaceae bacterium]